MQVVHTQGETEIYMTPDDFLRSITPGMKQPDGTDQNDISKLFSPAFNHFTFKGLGLDQFRRWDPKVCTPVQSCTKS